MSYSSWLAEVDAAFEGTGKRIRVRDISPSALLLGFEKGVPPEKFAMDSAAYSFQVEASGGTSPGAILSFLGDTSCLEALDRPQASFVVRCLTGLGWFCFGLALIFLIMGVAALLQTAGTPETASEPGVFPGVISSSPASRGSNVEAMPDMTGARALGFFTTAFSVFIIGILSWWGSAMLRGLYLMIKGQASRS